MSRPHFKWSALLDSINQLTSADGESHALCVEPRRSSLSSYTYTKLHESHELHAAASNEPGVSLRPLRPMRPRRSFESDSSSALGRTPPSSPLLPAQGLRDALDLVLAESKLARMSRSKDQHPVEADARGHHKSTDSKTGIDTGTSTNTSRSGSSDTRRSTSTPGGGNDESLGSKSSPGNASSRIAAEGSTSTSETDDNTFTTSDAEYYQMLPQKLQDNTVYI